MQVKKIFSVSNPDPLEVERAKKALEVSPIIQTILSPHGCVPTSLLKLRRWSAAAKESVHA
jgi:hypothetical protein